MAIHVHNSLDKLLRTRSCGGRRHGERGAGLNQFTVYASELDGASESRPIISERKAGALSSWQGADWVQQSSGALFMWQLPAAEDESPVRREPTGPSGGYSQALRRLFPGPQACWAVVTWNQGCRDGTQNKYPECSSSETTGLAASWQSGPASAPLSPEIPTIRKSSPSLSSPLPLTWHHSSSEHLSPPDSRLLSFPHQCHLPLGPPCSLCKWHPLESCKQGSWAPLGKQRFIQMGTYFSPTKEVSDAYPLNRWTCWLLPSCLC